MALKLNKTLISTLFQEGLNTPEEITKLLIGIRFDLKRKIKESR